MINLDDYFFEKLIYKEIALTRKNKEIGLNLVAPITLIPPSDGLKEYGIELPYSLQEVYGQIEYISIAWHIFPAPTFETQYNIPNTLKNDSFLKENYWDENVSWSVVHEYLSGSVGIQKLEDIINPEFCRKHIFDGIIDGLSADNFVPFDLHWNIMACLKKEDGKILDNIWIVYYDGKEMYDMQVGVEKYMELCYKAKGFYDWQLAYIFKEGENYELMKRFLPILFPDVKLDLSDFGIEL